MKKLETKGNSLPERIRISREFALLGVLTLGAVLVGCDSSICYKILGQYDCGAGLTEQGRLFTAGLEHVGNDLRTAWENFAEIFSWLGQLSDGLNGALGNVPKARGVLGGQ